MYKGVAGQVVSAGLVTASTLAAFTGTVTCYVTGDNGSQTLGSVGSGVCTSKGNGEFQYAPSAAEVSYDHISFTFIGTLAEPETVNVWTRDLALAGIVDFGTLQSVGSGTAVIRAAAAYGDNTLRGNIIGILGATQGYWQYSVISANVGSTDTITYDAMAVTPSGALSYAIFASPQGSATLLPTVLLSSGTGSGQLSLTSGTITLTDASLTAAKFASNAITAAVLASDAGAEIAAAVWDLATSGHTTAATFGAQVKTLLDLIATYIDTEVAAIKAKTDNLPSDPADASDIAAAFTTLTTTINTSRYQKNAIAADIPVVMVDSTDHVTRKTGLTLTVTRSIDGGAFGSATGTAAEIASGVYQFDASAADMNGNNIVLRFTGTAADPVELHIKTYT